MIVKATAPAFTFLFFLPNSFDKTNVYMKKLMALTAAVLMAAFPSYAQISKGATFIGGWVNLSFSKEEPENSTIIRKTNNWNVRPQVGKVIADNKVAGIFLNMGGSLSRQSASPANVSETKTAYYGGGVFYRRYYPLGQRFFFFGDGALGLSRFTDKRRNDNGTTNFIYYTANGLQANFFLSPGVSFQASRRLHLEASLSNLIALTYQGATTTQYTSPNTVHSRAKGRSFEALANANAFNNLAVGMRWILPGK